MKNLLLNDIKVYALKEKFENEEHLEKSINENRVNKYSILTLKDGNQLGLEVTLLKEEIQEKVDLIEPENLEKEVFELVSSVLNAMIEKSKEEDSNVQ